MNILEKRNKKATEYEVFSTGTRDIIWFEILLDLLSIIS